MTALELVIHNEIGAQLDEASLRRAARAVLELQGIIEPVEATLLVTTDAAVAALNLRFRGIASTTDILSFPADEPTPADGDTSRYLGDMILAYPYAAAQSQRENHDLGESLCLLIVHSMMHLLGFDHDTAESRATMWAAQDEVLRALGISTSLVPALESSKASHD